MPVSKRTTLKTVVLGSFLISAAAFAQDKPVIEYYKPTGMMNVKSFSQVTSATGGRMIFVSGQVAWDKDGKPQHAGDLEAQTRMVYENLRLALNEARATLDDVVKYTIYVKDLDTEKWKTVSKVRNEMLKKEPRPASTMIGVTGLVYPELLIEIEAIAVVKE